MFSEKAQKWSKTLARVGAVLSGIAVIIGGDMVNGVGLIAAAFAGSAVKGS